MSEKTSIWSVPFVALMGANFFQSVAAFATHVTLPVYAAQLGATSAMVGIISSCFAFTALVIRPFAGPAFDSFSRKWQLVLMLAIMLISYVLFSIADSLPVLIGVRMLQGVGLGCAGPLAMSLVSEYLPADKFASGISIYSLSQSIAQVVGPAMGVPLVAAFGFEGVTFVYIALLVAALLCALPIKEPFREQLPYELKLGRMFTREALPAATALLLLAVAFACSNAYIVLYGQSLGIEGLGLYFSIYAACLMLTRPLYGRLADKLGAVRLLVVGVLFFAGSYVTLHFASSFAGFVLAAVLGSAGYGACNPLLQSIALSSAPADRRGAASNTAYIGLDIGMLVGPVLGGMVIESFLSLTGSQTAAYSDMWVVMLVPVAVAFVMIVYWNIKESAKTSDRP